MIFSKSQGKSFLENEMALSNARVAFPFYCSFVVEFRQNSSILLDLALWDDLLIKQIFYCKNNKNVYVGPYWQSAGAKMGLSRIGLSF